MSKSRGGARAGHRCTACGATAPVWSGRCGSCDEWGTIAEVAAEDERRTVVRPAEPAQPIGEVSDAGVAPLPTGVGELDRVLAGGVVPGSVIVLGGEPGIGKSTLLLAAAAGLARAGVRTLYLTAEESPAQVRGRAARIGAVADELWLAADTSLPAVLGHLDHVQPAVVVVDSIQTVHDPVSPSAPGSVAQVRDCAYRLVEEARRRSVAVILVGHVTKEGGLAGPRVLEHLVDTVLSFEGDRHHALRLLRAVKHRFGGTGELGVFEMTGHGLAGVEDPSALFLADRRVGHPGSAVVPVLDGGRPLLVEAQALLTPARGSQPSRSAQGVDGNRLNMLLAVLGEREGVAFGDYDAWLTLAGGVRTSEPAVDLGVSLALVSARLGRPLPSDMVVCGEVGLGGEVRQVSRIERRLAEAARLGFSRVLVPAGSPEPPAGCAAVRVASLAEALLALGLGAARRGHGGGRPTTM